MRAPFLGFGGRGFFATTTLSTTDKGAGSVLSNGNRTVTISPTSTGATAIRSTTSKSAGKWAFEVSWDAADSTFANNLMGLISSGASLAAALSSANPGVSYRGDIVFLNGGGAGNTPGASFATGRVAMCYADFDAGTWSFIEDNVVQRSGTGLTAGTYFAGVSLNRANANAATVNFGQAAFVNTLPSGGAAWG